MLSCCVALATLAERQPIFAAASVDPKAEVAAALYAASATQAAAERAADAKLRAKRKEIEALRAQVQTGAAQHQAALTAAEEKYVAELTARDRAYAHEIAVFRKAVEDIAATPEGVAALARFNAGDEPGAITVLDQLRAAHDAARKKRADLESAVEGRRIAALTLEARTKGKFTTAQVITRYEELTRLDPGVFSDWVELGRLYKDGGNLAGALRAAQAAAKLAEDDRGRSVAHDDIGDVLVAQGDGAGALASYRKGLAIRETLAKRDPENTEWQRDLSVSHNKIGDVLVAQGDGAGALASYRKGLAIGETLAKRDPENTEWQRDLIVSYVKLNQTSGDKAHVRKALDIAQAMQKRGTLAPRDAWMVDELKRMLGE
jgi:tetratricopeptide (TPR) repeat protein